MTTEQILSADQAQQAEATLQAQANLPPADRDGETIVLALNALAESGRSDMATLMEQAARLLTEMIQAQGGSSTVTVDDLERLIGSGGGGQSAGAALLGGVGETAPPPPAIQQPTGPKPIGVPSGFAAAKTLPVTGQTVFGGAPVVTPRYFEGDQFLPQPLTPSKIKVLQQRLTRAGLLKEGDFFPGFWDDVSADAYKTALGYANRAGQPVEQVLKTLSSLAPERRPTVQETILPPDPATLAQEVKSVFRRRLGREPSDAELQAMAKELGVLTEQATEAEQAIAAGQVPESQVQAAVKAPEQIQRLPDSPGAAAFVTPSVPDPASQFLELFDERFGPEIARRERVAGTAAQQQNVMRSLTTMQALIGG